MNKIKKLESIETQIEELAQSSNNSLLKIGELLKYIRDNKLYKNSYDTFSDYCFERWHYQRSRAYQLIDFYKITEPFGNDIQNERQARALKSVKTEQRKEVLKKAQARADHEGRDLSHRDIEAVISSEKSNDSERFNPKAKKLAKLQELFLNLSDSDRAKFLQWAKAETSKAA